MLKQIKQIDEAIVRFIVKRGIPREQITVIHKNAVVTLFFMYVYFVYRLFRWLFELIWFVAKWGFKAVQFIIHLIQVAF